MPISSRSLVAFLVLIYASHECQSFVPLSPRKWGSNNKYNVNKRTGGGNYNDNNNSNNGNGPPRHPGFNSGWNDNDDENHFSGTTLFSGLFFATCRSEKEHNLHEWAIQDCNIQNKHSDDDDSISIRGGDSTTQSTSVKEKPSGLKGIVSYWSTVLSSAGSSLLSPFRFVSSKVSSLFSPTARKEKAIKDKLNSVPIQSVIVRQNSTVLPPEIVTSAAQQSGLLGNPISPEIIQDVAMSLKRWYVNQGYVLATVTGATLDAPNATAEIEVEEPLVSDIPVKITFLKKMIVDKHGEVLTFRQYKEQHLKEYGPAVPIQRSALNTTYVPTSGKTSPKRISKALNLLPGKPFQWQGERWQTVMSSGVFSQILGASPQRMEDGTAQLHVLVTERPPRNLEYGMTKSLYTGSWEGEVDFVNGNLFGGGEVIGLMVRRGTSDAETSARLRFSDSKFGQAGGYNVDVFSEFIGDQLLRSEGNGVTDYNHDTLLSRRGATVQFQNPIDPSRIRNTLASASLERTSTRSGHHENLASGTVDVGPFFQALPMNTRSSVVTTISSGVRVPEGKIGDKAESLSSKLSLSNTKPYSSGSITTKQVLPLLSGKASLALSHTVMTSGSNFPRHEANSAGIAASVRGYDPRSNGPIRSSMKGTTEIRIPVKLPIEQVRQDAGIVLFGDWLVAKSYRGSDSTVQKSSIGVGIRKSIQGVPLKYDFSYTKDGKIGATFGIGSDFDV